LVNRCLGTICKKILVNFEKLNRYPIKIRRSKMNNQTQERHGGTLNMFAGLLVGSLAGAATMLLLAPQSGKVTRMKIQEKGTELRDRTFDLVDDTIENMRSKTNTLTSTGRKKIKELKHQGQNFAVEQLDRVSEAAEAGKEAIQGPKTNGRK
jgi:gas vesicle protein